MKVVEAIWINERWIGLCMEKWWWELWWSRGGVGWRGEGENTHVMGGAACSLSLYIYAFMCMHMFVIQCCLLFFSFQLNAVYYGY